MTENVFPIKHPLLMHKLALLRAKTTPPKIFRELIEEITAILSYHATSDLSLTEVTIETPLTKCQQSTLVNKHPIVVPILRAGLSMANGFLQIMPTARVGHIGIYRNEETLKPHDYYLNIPKASAQTPIFVCDPMLATGGTANFAIQTLKKRGFQTIKFICILAAPEGIQALHEVHPDIPIYTSHIDIKLNEIGYIVPGLGDAGDRSFGTLE